ncbi:MAG: hypothetical protein AB9844_12280 [Clostridiaceae bacterium]
MSAFLGMIHYWLYNKIQLHEDLMEDIIKIAEDKNISIEELKTEANSKFGNPERRPLEEAINHGNIHGWLQSKIQSVENRTAWIVTGLLKNNSIGIEEISKLYYDSGKKKRLESQDELSPKELYTLIFDNMLEGMPCDRINEPVSESENEFSWNTTRCLHKESWDNANGDISNFYILRDSWIKGFIGENNSYIRTEDGLNTIRRAF